MDKVENYMRKFKKSGRTKSQVLADMIYLYFNKELDYPRIMSMMREKGYQFIFETFQEVKKADAKNHLSLFIWRINQQKILWE